MPDIRIQGSWARAVSAHSDGVPPTIHYAVHRESRFRGVLRRYPWVSSLRLDPSGGGCCIHWIAVLEHSRADRGGSSVDSEPDPSGEGCDSFTWV